MATTAAMSGARATALTAELTATNERFGRGDARIGRYAIHALPRGKSRGADSNASSNGGSDRRKGSRRLRGRTSSATTARLEMRQIAGRQPARAPQKS